MNVGSTYLYIGEWKTTADVLGIQQGIGNVTKIAFSFDNKHVGQKANVLVIEKSETESKKCSESQNNKSDRW